MEEYQLINAQPVALKEKSLGWSEPTLLSHTSSCFVLHNLDYLDNIVLCASPHRDHVGDDGHKAGVGHHQPGLKASIY